jgi:tetratricopeptide (TPR) repeat protein
MNERDTTLLNDYFNGLLSPSDAQLVRDRAAAEPDFGQEFSLREEMEAFPRRAEQRKQFTDTLISVEKDFFQENSSEKTQPMAPMKVNVNWVRWLAAAASVAMVAAAYWFFSQSTVPEYRQYAQHDPLSLTVRGVNDQTVSEAEKAFAAADYAKALAALDQLLTSEPDNITAQQYKGICLIETNRNAEARAVLTPIANGQSALRGEANWYIALSYLKEENYTACKTALENIEPAADHYKKAQELLKELK